MTRFFTHKFFKNSNVRVVPLVVMKLKGVHVCQFNYDMIIRKGEKSLEIENFQFKSKLTI